MFLVQYSTLTYDNGDYDENGVVVRICVLMQVKQIQSIKRYDQKPNKTAQKLIP